MKERLSRLAPAVKRILREVEERNERKRAEEALEQERKFIEEALDAHVDTFFVFEPVTGKAIRWNKAFSEISGYSDKEIGSMKIPDSYYSKEDLYGGMGLWGSNLCMGVKSLIDFWAK